MVVAHAILCTIGFLILLPAGALLARYARTFTNVWFKGHWLFQLLFGEWSPRAMDEWDVRLMYAACLIL